MKVLKDWAQADRDAYEKLCDRRGCHCFISAPCNCCTHPGHPLNQEEDEFWDEVFDLDEACDKAVERLSKEIDLSYEQHKLGLFRAGWRATMGMLCRHNGWDFDELMATCSEDQVDEYVLFHGDNKKCLTQQRCV